MDNRTERSPDRKQPLINRLDAAAQDLNAILLVLAIGLAVLDFTCFFAFEVRNAIPPRIAADASLIATPATAAIPPAQAMAPAATATSAAEARPAVGKQR
jgi:hypothetical protein